MVHRTAKDLVDFSDLLLVVEVDRCVEVPAIVAIEVKCLQQSLRDLATGGLADDVVLAGVREHAQL